MEKLSCKFEKYKHGFTLAEVLITLVIIGVVAAMTIPNVIYETKKKEYSARLKKFYSMLKQASLRAESDNKSWNDWLYDNGSESSLEFTEAFQNKCLLPYISYYKVEKQGGSSHAYYVYLNDGTRFFVSKESCIDFQFDVNGDKGPNEKGRDIFYFLYCPDFADSVIDRLTVIPYQSASTTSREDLLQACRTKNHTCSGLLMLDGWEFKDDYPYRL